MAATKSAQGHEGAAYDVHDVASATIRVALAEGHPISNLQLQKILYLCQLAYVRDRARLLFGEDIVAWQYGPVVKEAYHEYSYRGASSLKKAHMTKRDWRKDAAVPVEELDDDAMSVIKSVVKAWCERPMWDLVGETHKKGGPWDMVYNPEGKPAGAGYDDVIDPWTYAWFYDPETCSLKLGKKRGGLMGDDSDDVTDGQDAAADADDNGSDGGIELTITVPAGLAGVVRERANALGKAEWKYVEDLVNAVLRGI